MTVRLVAAVVGPYGTESLPGGLTPVWCGWEGTPELAFAVRPLIDRVEVVFADNCLRKESCEQLCYNPAGFSGSLGPCSEHSVEVVLDRLLLELFELFGLLRDLIFRFVGVDERLE